MATFKTQPVGGGGVDLSAIDIAALGDYSFWRADRSSVRLYNDDGNYTSFSGSGIRYDAPGGALQDVTAGTVTKIDIAINGVKLLAASGLKLSAEKIFDLYINGDSKGALAYFLAGNDKISGTKYADVLMGGKGADVLSGGGGKDILKGDAGNDKLYGGDGGDRLTGGSGADTFIFKSIKDSTVAASGRDTILDFSRSQKDKIDLAAIDASTKAGGDQAFKFIGTDAFHNKAGELRFEKKGGDTLIHGDVNGDGKADFSILVDASITFKAGDFLL
ncbi:calcium-binding protein [Shinella sp.]|uniref:calcium-binding protein n=1 Tax=Shinella sp. TaxID=1870904 RepID=UPI003F6F2F0C